MNTNLHPELHKRVGELYKLPETQAEEVAKILMKFMSFGFDASFKSVEEGPVVRTYYFQPSPSAILSKVLNKEEDLAMVLGVESVRVARELQYITIAVPRADRQTIMFDKSLLKLFEDYKSLDMTLPILMGQNPKGENFYIDLATQPHALISGTTGSGKSVFTSQLIASLSLLLSPDELEFTLVDTKQLDLVLFDGLPHISGVVKDIHELRVQLEFALGEVRKRVATMSGVCRNIKEWNALNPHKKMKYQVIIIDEYADVVTSDKAYLASVEKEFRPQSIESYVKMLAQISRAAGVHLIIATQRPSAKILDGDIKTNFPCRICFQLPTMTDSRVVLDENGAEKLLGKGDYLYKTSTTPNIQRAHSAFVSANMIAMVIAQSEMLRIQYIGGQDNERSEGAEDTRRPAWDSQADCQKAGPGK